MSVRSLVDKAADFYSAQRGFESCRTRQFSDHSTRSNTATGRARHRRDTVDRVRETCEAKAGSDGSVAVPILSNGSYTSVSKGRGNKAASTGHPSHLCE